MSRHGYVDDWDEDVESILATGRWKGRVNSAIRGKRGQKFLRELAVAMDAMPIKELIREELIDEEGQVCAIGVVCKSRGLDVSTLDVEDYDAVGKAVDIAGPMAAEIEYENDEHQVWEPEVRRLREETPAERWIRMRKWVEKRIKPDAAKLLAEKGS